MFLRFSPLLIVFLSFLGLSSSALAYTNQGVDNINPRVTMRLAIKEGLVSPKHEDNIKKELVQLKKKHPKKFQEKLSQGLENGSAYQGYLLEVQDGLKKIENAKKVAKYEVYKKVEANWNDLKQTALNVNVDKSFKAFRHNLVKRLNENLVYVRPKKGTKDNDYHFEIDQWATVTVSPTLQNVNWKIEFDHAYDDNQLEKGAEDIKIDNGSGGPKGFGGDDSGEEAPPSEDKSF